METVEKATVASWLGMLGCTPSEVNDADTAWHLEFDYPNKSGHRMHVAQPKDQAQQIVIASGLTVSHEHLKAFEELAEDEQREFALGLRRVLNRPEVEFQLDGAPRPDQCPQRIQLSRARYADGLTLDSFAETVGFVFKAELHAIWYVQDRLGERNLGNGGRFDFRRAGL